jgi:hypothetical protein
VGSITSLQMISWNYDNRQAQQMYDRSDIAGSLCSLCEVPFTDAIENRDNLGAPATILALCSLSARIDMIAEAVFHLVPEMQIYSCKILMRSLIEHFFRFQFVFNGWIQSRNDSRANQYLSCLISYEELRLFRTLKRYDGLVEGVTRNDSAERILDKHLRKRKIPQTEVQRASVQFGFNRLVETLMEDIKSSKQRAADPFLAGLFPRYADLSAFVHGGPLADIIMGKFKEEERRQTECEEEADHALSVASIAKYWILVVLYNLDKKFGPSLFGYRELLDKHELP